jgi:hypothetical protein
MIWILMGIAILVAGAFVYYFNRIIVLENRVNNGWAQIDVQASFPRPVCPSTVQML